MKRSILLLFLLSSCVLGAQDISNNPRYDSLKKISQSKMVDDVKFPAEERYYRHILSRQPENMEANKAIIYFYGGSYNSVPIMALTLLNIIDSESKDAKKRIKEIKKLYRRFLSFSSEGTTVHVAPKFVADWDSGYENNLSPLEAGFTVAGAIDYAPEEKHLNSAERMIKKFDVVFSKVPNFRSRYHGTYWDIYVDYFTKLHQSDHFCTAMYVVMGKTNEKEIREWLQHNPDKIAAFREWHKNNITLLSKE